VAAVRENEIGRCRCPVCASDRARLRVSAKQLAYVTCDTCNAQIFARSDRSDEKLRSMLVAEAAPAAPEAAPAAAPAPVAAAVPARAPEASAAPSWGALSWMK